MYLLNNPMGDMSMEFVLKYWVEVIFGLIVSGLGLGYRKLSKKIEQKMERQEAVEDGIQALLRDSIIHSYNNYMEKECCPIYALENIEAMYKSYSVLGGNGTVTQLVKRLKELPTDGEGVNHG